MFVQTLNFNNNHNTFIAFSANHYASCPKYFEIIGEDIVNISRKLTPREQKNAKRERKIVKMVLQNYKQHEIAKKMKLSTSIVNNIAAKYNAFQIKKEIRDKKILEDIINGISRKEIAEKNNIDKRSLDFIARGLKAFDQYISARDQRILELRKEGFSTKKIAELLNISDATVRRAENKYNTLDSRS